MEELGEFGADYKKRQKELEKKQVVFEADQNLLEKARNFIEEQEYKRHRIWNWTIMGITILFLLFLAWVLLF
ncbi:MAG: hypothetical protein PF542_02095 [Nanoarchaeota archaeon]|jgi:hypothetical protein|nr:hypothetical protein [Nanoarchaeota archaeon]